MQSLLSIAVITVFEAALRLCFLENATLWFDERVSWELAVGSWKHFWYRISQWEADMLFYYLLLRLWLYLGESEWILRSLSVVSASQRFRAVYILGIRLFCPKAGLISATLLSLHMFHVRYSQEARTYALLTFLLVLSTLFLRPRP
jgi:uncharacterized membrane protein